MGEQAPSSGGTSAPGVCVPSSSSSPLRVKANARFATMTEVQSERAYLKQSHIGTAQLKGIFKKKVAGKDGYRYYKNVGLGFKTPRDAVEGTYIDKKCPFTGNVSIRGRILTGIVKSMKMNRTIVLRRDYLHFIKKYQRYEKRHKTLSAHMSPCFRDVNLGDLVTVGQCRPLSKTVRFNVLKVAKSVASKKT